MWRHYNTFITSYHKSLHYCNSIHYTSLVIISHMPPQQHHNKAIHQATVLRTVYKQLTVHSYPQLRATTPSNHCSRPQLISNLKVGIQCTLLNCGVARLRLAIKQRARLTDALSIPPHPRPSLAFSVALAPVPPSS